MATTNSSGKVWLITSGTSPLGFSIARQAIRAGDSIAIGCPVDFDRKERQSYTTEVEDKGEVADVCDVEYLQIWGGRRCLCVPLDIREIASCQAALARMIEEFGRVDILLNCPSESFAGTLEETAEWQARAQFEYAYYGPINTIKTVIGEMRRRGTGGHIINVTSLTAHMGTPGLSLLTAAHHALEGFSEALAFEIAPFNIKVTNVEPSLATHLLTTSCHLPPSHSAYANQPSPIRSLLASRTPSDPPTPSLDQPTSASPALDGLTPSPLSVPIQFQVVTETVRVIMAIAGKDNPPGRVIVGGEGEGVAEDGEGGVQSVKERMKTVSEELEEFLECGLSVDTGPDADVEGVGGAGLV